MKTIFIKKITGDGADYLPCVYETELVKWYGFDGETMEATPLQKDTAIIYSLAEPVLNYYQFNSPTAYGNPEYSVISGILQGYLMAKNIEMKEIDNKAIFYKGKKTYLIIEKPDLPDSHINEVKEINHLRRVINL